MNMYSQNDHFEIIHYSKRSSFKSLLYKMSFLFLLLNLFVSFSMATDEQPILEEIKNRKEGELSEVILKRFNQTFSNKLKVNEEQKKYNLDDIKNFVNTVTNNSFIQKLQQLFNQKIFLEKLLRIINHSRRNQFIYLEIGAILIVLLLQEWMMRDTNIWWKRFFIKILFLPIFMFVLAIFIPWILFGDDYIDILKDIYSVFK